MADAREQHVWTNHAAEQAPETPYEKSEVVEELLKLAKIKTGTTVVDLGCGSGLWRRVFKKYNYIGIDQNTAMIQVAEGRDFTDIKKTTKFGEGNLRHLTMVPAVKKLKGKIDLVWSSAVIQHNLHADKDEIMKEIYEMLSPNGFYMCTENTFTPDNYAHVFSEYKEDMSDGYSFTRKGWTQYFEKHGFAVLNEGPFNFYLIQKVG